MTFTTGMATFAIDVPCKLFMKCFRYIKHNNTHRIRNTQVNTFLGIYAQTNKFYCLICQKIKYRRKLFSKIIAHLSYLANKHLNLLEISAAFAPIEMEIWKKSNIYTKSKYLLIFYLAWHTLNTSFLMYNNPDHIHVDISTEC